MGLISKVVPDNQLEAASLALAREIAGSATYALTLAKRMFQYMYVPTLEQLLEMEVLAIMRCAYDPRPRRRRHRVQGKTQTAVQG